MSWRETEFTQCLEKADLPSCTWYLEQLKAVSLFYSICRLHSSHLNNAFSVPGSCCTVLKFCVLLDYLLVVYTLIAIHGALEQ